LSVQPNCLPVFANGLAGPSEPRKHDSPKVSDSGIRRTLALGGGQFLKRHLESILFQSNEALLERIVLGI
jgi:hypothetical protein